MIASAPLPADRPLAGDDPADPEPLVTDGQMLHHPQACPAGGQHRPPQRVFCETVEDPEHIVALIVQG